MSRAGLVDSFMTSFASKMASVASGFYDLDVIVCWSRVGSVSTYVGVEFSDHSQALPFLERFSPTDPWLSVNQKIDRSV